MMADLDDAILDADFDPTEFEGLLTTKIDSIGGLLDEWEERAEGLKAAAKKRTEKAKRWEAKRERLLGYVQMCMERDGFEKLPGKEYAAKLTKSEAIECLQEPTAMLRSQFPALVRAKYEWNKTPAKKLLKAGEPLPEGVFELKTSIKCKIELRGTK
jgi:DNA repair exonuclease SbcCD ATPase subunit